jgi:glycerol-3-phosphate acyltransferase PlsX
MVIPSQGEQMRIAVDAMRSDDCPGPDVGGTILAARRWPADEYILVGDANQIEAELAMHDASGSNLSVVHAEQIVTMTDKPSAVVRGKPDSSMHVGLQLVKDGEADAFVSAGNTGALAAVATLGALKRIRGVKRPANAPLVPTPSGGVLALDMGLNADCRPEHLAQFALMGSVYTERVLGVENPRVALISIGEEEGKGNELVREASYLLADSQLNFVGNAEPKDLFTGHADVAVADGFTCNIFIKTLEAGVKMFGTVISDEIRAGLVTTLGGLLVRPAFKRVSKRYSSETVGGAPFLGLNGVVISAHGRSNDVAIMNAVRQARHAVKSQMLQAIREGLKA